MVFSQPNVSFYYYEDEMGYTYFDLASNNSSGGASNASVYYDDGLYFAGYKDGDSGGGGLSGQGLSGDGAFTGDISSSYSAADQSALLG